MSSSSNAEAFFVDNGVKVAYFDFDNMKITTFLPMQEVAERFWKLIDEQLQENNRSTVSFANSDGKEVVEIDGCTRRIIHEMWDPEASYVLSELERLGTDGGGEFSGAVA
jgi:hypothetical protein